MAKTTLTYVLLLIDRDASTKIPVEVPDYEQQILEEIYGEDLVFEQSSREVEVEDFDVQKAFDGLVSKYQHTPDGDRARKSLFPKVSYLEKLIGVKVGAAKADGSSKSKKPAVKDGGSLAEGTVAEITAQLEGLSDAELDQLADDETAGKDRSGVHAAIEAEREKRSIAQ